MLRLPKIKIAFQLAAALLYTTTLRAADYNHLPICAFGVGHSFLNLKIEEDVLVPSLVQYPIDDSALIDILPFGSEDQRKLLTRTIVSWPGITLGHAMPYIYLAINHAFDRIYFNSYVKHRTEEDSARRAQGFMDNTDSGGYRNIRDILSIREIANTQLNIEVYSTLTALRKAQRNLQFVSDEAFWDPSTMRIGLYLDPALFHWLPSQVSWGDETVRQSASAVRDYLTKRVIQTIGHELVHFIQFVSGVKAYYNPFLAESSATFIEENIALREDLFQLAYFETDSSSLPDPNTTCGILMLARPSLSGPAMAKLENSIKTKPSDPIDLERLITMDEKTFYGHDSATLRRLYNISLAFCSFVSTLPRDTFQLYFNSVLKTGHLSSPAILAGLNEYFDRWTRMLTRTWWRHNDTSSVYDDIRDAVNTCMDSHNYSSAYMGANIMVTLHQTNPESWMYMGDIFWNLQIPFFAFDYYARALAVGNKYGYPTISRLMIESRIGDGYEKLGDLPSALDWYKRFIGANPDTLNVAELLVLLRSKLKKDFYGQVVARGEKQTQAALDLIDSYVSIFQLRGCPGQEEKEWQTRMKEAWQQNHFDILASLLKETFTEIDKRMMADIAHSSNYQEILQRNKERCKP